MVGESHVMKQPKKQWEKLDAEGHKIMNDLLMTEAERIEWPENKEPKWPMLHTTPRQKDNLFWQDSTSKKTNQVRYTRLIHLLQLPSSKKRVCCDQHTQQTQTQHQICCHSTLLPLDLGEKHNSACTTLLCNSQCTPNQRLCKTAIKDAHTEEALRQRIPEQECYSELVQTITTAITDISEAENPSVGYKNKIDKIKCIREKRVKPSCKILSGHTVFSDF